MVKRSKASVTFRGDPGSNPRTANIAVEYVFLATSAVGIEFNLLTVWAHEGEQLQLADDFSLEMEMPLGAISGKKGSI